LIKQLLKVVVMLGVLVGFAGAESTAIKVHNSWIRLTPPVVKNSAGYASIYNGSDADVKLVAVKSGLSKKIEIHEHKMVDGLMKMREVAGGLTIPAKTSVELKPGGYHIMLMGLNLKLDVAQEHNLILVFDNGDEVPMIFPVKHDVQTQGMAHTN